MTDDDIELSIDWAGEAGAFVRALREVGFLDGESDGYAVKLDCGWDQPEEETAGAALSKVLSGPESDDPLVRGLIEDQADELMAMVRVSYSQAAAYVILLVRVEWDLGDLAELVWVGRDTIRRRLGRAAGWVAVQPSRFDGVEAIPEDFAPWRWRWLAGFRYETPEGQGMFWPAAA